MRSWWLCQTPEFSPVGGGRVPLIRSIGRWTMTALVINAIIGSGIFGLPSELTRLLGRASPLAMLVAAFAMATMILCMAEVAPVLRGGLAIPLYSCRIRTFLQHTNRMVPTASRDLRFR